MTLESAIVSPCEQGTVSSIASLYAQINANPHARTSPELFRLCLAKLDQAVAAAKATDEVIFDLGATGYFGLDAQTQCLNGA